MNRSPSYLARVKAVVGEAAGLPVADRASFIQSRCDGDPALVAEVTSLLRASDSSDAVICAGADAWVAVGVGAAPPPDLEVGADLGGFVVERVIGQSPTSVVYAARQQRPERVVALKVLRGVLPLIDGGARFRLEATAAARVEHPNVVRIYEAGILSAPRCRLPYIAMELVEGVPITEHAKANRFHHREIVELVLAAAAGVSAMHQRGVIHRDLKPSNILVPRSGGVKIVDFGIARFSGADRTWHTLEGAVLGTPGYTSPEQVENAADVDVRTDVWALGVLLYQMLSGLSPFQKRDAGAIDALRAVTLEDAPPLRRHAPSVDRDLERVVKKAMARRREDRYATVDALSADLDNALHKRPVTACPPTLAYRASRFARRQAAPLALAGVAVIALAIFVAMQVRAWRQARQQRDRAAEVAELVRGMISSADPNFGHRDVLMREVLAGLEVRLDGRAGLQPLIEADVRSLLGRLSFELGDYEHSKVLLERAVALRDAPPRDDIAGLVSDQAALAQTLRWLYEPDAAAALAKAALDRGTSRFGPSHRATLEAREVFAGSSHDLGRLEEAEREYRAVLAARRADRTPAADEIAGTRSNLASVLSDMGRYADAERELREILAAWTEAKDRRRSTVVRGNLALAVAAQGRLDDAVTILKAAESDAHDVLGPVHPTTVTLRSNLIEFIRQQGNEVEALDLSRDLLDRCVRAFGWSHDRTLSTYTGYATSLVRSGRAIEALDIAGVALAEGERALPPDSAWLARLGASLAAALAANAKHAEAITRYDTAVSRLEAALGPTHRETLSIRNNLAIAMTDGGRAADAAQELEAVLRTVQEHGYAEMEQVISKNLGRALLESGQHERGVTTLTAAYEQSTARQERQNAAACAGILASYFQRRGDAAAAAAWVPRADVPK